MKDDPLQLIKWGEYFKAGGAMSFPPKVIGEMSVWEFHMTFAGWKAANGQGDGDSAGGSDSAPSDDAFEAAIARAKAKHGG